jgi:hypothetical protein
MKEKLFLLTAAVCLLITSVLNAQVSTPNNNATGGLQFVGYSGTPAANTKHLNIKNNYAAKDINFFTNQTGTNGTSVQRMVIKGSGTTAGFVGIGNNFYAPTSQLHVNDGIFDTYTQITNNTTGATENDGLRIGVLGINGPLGTPTTVTQSHFFKIYQIV